MEENQLEQAYAAPLRAILDRVGATDIEQLSWQFNFTLKKTVFKLHFDDGIELQKAIWTIDECNKFHYFTPFYVPLEQEEEHERELEARLNGFKNGEQPKNPYHHY